MTPMPKTMTAPSTVYWLSSCVQYSARVVGLNPVIAPLITTTARAMTMIAMAMNAQIRGGLLYQRAGFWEALFRICLSPQARECCHRNDNEKKKLNIIY